LVDGSPIDFLAFLPQILHTFINMNIIKNNLFKRICSSVALVCFLFNTIVPTLSYAQATFVPPIAKGIFQPTVIKGLRVFPENPFRFDFVLSLGDKTSLKSQGAEKDYLKQESNKLIKYFLAALTIPEKDLWVNLSPKEKDRIIADGFGKTQMGQELLAQDFLLKKITATLMSPENEYGKKFWNKIHQMIYERYGRADIPIDTLNKVWIVPGEAVVYENENVAYVTKARLKVLLENEYTHSGVIPANAGISISDRDSRQLRSDKNELTAQMIKEIIIPQLEKEVNDGEQFAPLRQIYYSLILAAWYKQALANSLINKIYSNKKKTLGVNPNDAQFKEKIYQNYLKAFQQGITQHIREEYDPNTKEIVARRYFTGGANLEVSKILQKNHDFAMIGESEKTPVVQVMIQPTQEDSDEAMVTEDIKEPALHSQGIDEIEKIKSPALLSWKDLSERFMKHLNGKEIIMDDGRKYSLVVDKGTYGVPIINIFLLDEKGNRTENYIISFLITKNSRNKNVIEYFHINLKNLRFIPSYAVVDHLSGTIGGKKIGQFLIEKVLDLIPAGFYYESPLQNKESLAQLFNNYYVDFNGNVRKNQVPGLRDPYNDLFVVDKLSTSSAKEILIPEVYYETTIGRRVGQLQGWELKRISYKGFENTEALKYLLRDAKNNMVPEFDRELVKKDQAMAVKEVELTKNPIARQLPGGAIMKSQLSDKMINILSFIPEGARIISKENRYFLRELGWMFTETSFKDLNRKYKILEKIIELDQNRQDKNVPIVILDWGCGEGTGLVGLLQEIKKLGILNVEIIGYSDEYYEEWEELPEGITVIFDIAENLPRYIQQETISFIYTHLGLSHLLRDEGISYLEILRKLMAFGSSLHIGYYFENSRDYSEENINKMGFQKEMLSPEKEEYQNYLWKLIAVSPYDHPMSVEKKDVGGIDFTLNRLNLAIERSGDRLEFDTQQIENISFDGFIPVIINILPQENLAAFLHLP